MKKIIILALALTLSACAGMPKSVLDGGTSIFADTTNPVTKERLFQIEATLSTAAAAAVVYRRSCLNGTLPASCRSVVEKMRSYSATARGLVKRLRVFVRNNDQVNAIQVLIQLNGVIAELRGAAL